MAVSKRLHTTWINIRQRCTNPNAPAFRNYGARGITMCDRWSDLAAFAQDVGDPPTSEHTLDRIDNNRGYEPKNVRWATRKEQMQNVRYNVKITFDGETHVMSEWARKCGVTPSTMHYRIRKWGEVRAVTTPNLQHTN